MINKQVFKEIVDGWSNLIIKDDSVEPIAKARLEHCVDCPEFTKTHCCGICHCFMPAKVRSLTSKCDLGKW